MSLPLRCETHAGLARISDPEWERLFPGLPDPAALIYFVQQCGLDGFEFHSVTVQENDRVVLYVPLFEVTYAVSGLLDGFLRAVTGTIGRWLPRVLRPRILGLGFVEGEWGQIGYVRQSDPTMLRAAWGLAWEAIGSLQQAHRIDMTALVNFTEATGRIVPPETVSRFATLSSMPYGQVPIVFNSVEAYLSSLSKSTRKDLRRKLRDAGRVSIQRTRDPGPWIDDIYRWYRDTAERGEMVFGLHRRAYFERVCDAVPGAEYVLYFIDGTVAAFNLILRTPDCLLDKYFGMHETLGREHDLYFVSWIENIRDCIDHGLPLYHAGQGTEMTKQRLGANLIPSINLFAHRGRVAQSLLKALARRVAYQSPVALPSVRLGLGWTDASSVEPAPQRI